MSGVLVWKALAVLMHPYYSHPCVLRRLSFKKRSSSGLSQFPPYPRASYFQVRISIPGRNLSLGHGNMGVCVCKDSTRRTQMATSNVMQWLMVTLQNLGALEQSRLFSECVSQTRCMLNSGETVMSEWDAFSASLPGAYQRNEWGGPSVCNKP